MALPPGGSWFGRRDESSYWGTSIFEGPGAGASGQRLYAGLSRGLRRGPVQEISLSRFAAGNRVSVRSDLAPKFEGREVARRARSRIGEANYRLFTNSCELRSLASRTPLRSTQASAG